MVVPPGFLLGRNSIRLSTVILIQIKKAGWRVEKIEKPIRSGDMVTARLSRRPVTWQPRTYVPSRQRVLAFNFLLSEMLLDSDPRSVIPPARYAHCEKPPVTKMRSACAARQRALPVRCRQRESLAKSFFDFKRSELRPA
jgi:hypothetical protein